MCLSGIEPEPPESQSGMQTTTPGARREAASGSRTHASGVALRSATTNTFAADNFAVNRAGRNRTSRLPVIGRLHCRCATARLPLLVSEVRLALTTFRLRTGCSS